VETKLTKAADDISKEANKNLESSEVINKREQHYQFQLSEQLKNIKRLEE
jgi:hypothetical protein